MSAAPMDDQVIAFLRERNPGAWLVGGYVRDRLMGVRSHDVDIIVREGGIRWARTISGAFGGAWFILDEQRDVGRAVLGRESASPLYVDVARLRAPELLADLSLRDFTINAMAQGFGSQDDLVDPFGGRADLSEKSIRAVSEGAFVDDPLRILRGVRLAAELQFRIEDATYNLMRRDAPLLQAVASERVREELDRIVSSAGAHQHLREMALLDMLRFVLPESAAQIGVTQSAPHREDVFDHTRSVMACLEGLLAQLAELAPDSRSSGADRHPDAVRIAGERAWGLAAELLGDYGEAFRRHLQVGIGSGRSRTSLLMWAALMHDWGKPDARSSDGRAVHFYGHEEKGARLAEERATSLHFSHAEIRYLRAVVGLHMRLPLLAQEQAPSDRALYRFCRDAAGVGPDLVLLALADRLSVSGAPADSGALERTIGVGRSVMGRYCNSDTASGVPRPLFDGVQIMKQLGIPSGPLVGQLIEELREAQAVGEVVTEADALGWLLRRSERDGG